MALSFAFRRARKDLCSPLRFRSIVEGIPYHVVRSGIGHRHAELHLSEPASESQPEA